MALYAYFSGSPHDYQQGHGFAAWIMVVLPARCPHCGREHVTILWGTYLRWVYIPAPADHTDPIQRLQIRIERVRCTICGVTDALLPSFLHMFRRYALPLIQQALLLALDQGLWGRALVDAVGLHGYPVPATIYEWVWSFVLSAEKWLLLWLLQVLLTVDAQAALDPGPPPPALLSIPQPHRRAAFIQGQRAIRQVEALYAAVRAEKPGLVFQAQSLLAFLTASLNAAGRPPRVLWPAASVRPP